MKKWIRPFLISSLGLCICLNLSAKSAMTASATQEVQAKLNAISSMTANFQQVVKAGSREISNTKGSMALLRPGRFRWQTDSPIQQLVLADGKTLWIYDADLEQVTVKDQDDSVSGTPALFLSRGNNTVSRDFNVIKVKSRHENPETTVFELHAKSNKENYQRLLLTFNGAALIGIEFYDQLSQHTVVQLKDIQSNTALATSLFHFKPPKGVDVVRQ